jgi:hypothetical protein
MNAKGELTNYLAGLRELEFDDYSKNQEAIKQLYSQFFSKREASEDEVNLWSCIAHSVKINDLQLMGSPSNGNEYGPKSKRCETTLQGWREQQFPFGYKQYLTVEGKSVIKSFKKGIEDAKDHFGAVKSNAYILTWNGCDDGLMGSHADYSSHDVDGKGFPYRHTNRIVLSVSQSFDFVVTMRLHWPERDEENDSVRIRQKKVGSIVITHDSSFSSMILSPIGAGRHAGFSMEDPADGILKAVVFEHETRVSKDSDDIFGARGIIVSDLTFKTTNESKVHFEQFHRDLTYRIIASNRVESAGEIAKVIKSMQVFKDPMTVEQRKDNENELINTFQKCPGDLNDYQKEKAMELIHKRETRLENGRAYSKATRERNKELMNSYLERPGDLDDTQIARVEKLMTSKRIKDDQDIQRHAKKAFEALFEHVPGQPIPVLTPEDLDTHPVWIKLEQRKKSHPNFGRTTKSHVAIINGSMEAFLRAFFVEGRNVRLSGFFSLFDGDFQISRKRFAEDFPYLFPELALINNEITRGKPITGDRCKVAIHIIDESFPKKNVVVVGGKNKKAKIVDDDEDDTE